MLGAGAGERVDRLVVVADDAEVVTVAEPVLEQLLLQQVDVLVLVDGERAVLRAERVAHLRVLLEEPQRELEQVFEVDQALGLLPPLVLAEDTVHQVDGDRRLAALGLGAVALDGNAAVLRPLDLGREIARGAELERRRQRVRDLTQSERLRGQDPPDALGCEVPQLAKRRRVEGSGADALHPERGEASAQLAGGLVGEGDRHDPRRLERAGRDLLRDPAGDRRRLAGARAREDADGAAHGLGRAPLLRVQAVERVHLATVPPRSARSVTKVQTPARPATRRSASASTHAGASPSSGSDPRTSLVWTWLDGSPARGQALRSRESTSPSPMCSTNRMRARGPPPYELEEPVDVEERAGVDGCPRLPDSCSPPSASGERTSPARTGFRITYCALENGAGFVICGAIPEAPLPQRTFAPRLAVEPPRVTGLQPLHARGEIRVRRVERAGGSGSASRSTHTAASRTVRPFSQSDR